MTTTPTVDFDTVKARQQAIWSSGNYSVIGSTLQIIGEALCEAVDIEAGETCSTSPPATATRLSPQPGVAPP